MRRAVMSVVAMGLCLVSVSGQGMSGIYPSPPWCPTCFVASHADSPTAGSTIDNNSVVWLWGGSCFNGAAPTAVTATASVSGNPSTVAVAYVTGDARPDVTAHLQASGCHGGHAVVAVWFPDGLAAGTTAVSVRLHVGDIFAYHLFQVTP